MPRLIRFLIFGALVGWCAHDGQAQTCTSFKGTFTTATPGFSTPNNTANPTCNAFALTWNSTGFSAITIQLEGSDNGSSWTAYTGTTTVLVGTNPSSNLSGAIVVQASSKLAFIRVNLTSATGTGGVNYQVQGSVGVTPAAKNGGSGGGIAPCTIVSSGLSCPGPLQSGTGSGAAGGLDLLAGTALSTASNAVTVTVPTSVTPYLLQLPGALGSGGFFFESASSVGSYYGPQGNSTIVQLASATPATSGHCAEFDSNLNIADAGAACGSGGSGGGGIITYSSSADALSGTQYIPVGGGSPASSTESDVQQASPAAATVSNMQVRISSALGVGNSSVFTWRDNGSSEAVTCTISGSSATSCTDSTHSFNAAFGDKLSIQIVTTGVVTPVNVLITTAFGTSSVGITSVFANTGPAVGAVGDLNATGRVEGINAVPLCTGFTPTTGQSLTYSTALSPNPCYTAVTPSAGASGALILLEEHAASASAALQFTTRNVAGQSGATFQTDFDDYMIELVNVVPGTSGATFAINFSTNGGSSYDTSAIYDAMGTFVFSTGNGLIQSTNQTAFPLSASIGTTGTAGIWGSYRLINAASSASYKLLDGSHTAVNAGSSLPIHINQGGWYRNTTAVNAFEMTPSAGNLASGSIRVYGISK